MDIFACSNCCELLDNKERKPISIDCGHTFCVPCFNIIKKEVPNDRKCLNCGCFLGFNGFQKVNISLLHLIETMAEKVDLK